MIQGNAKQERAIGLTLMWRPRDSRAAQSRVRVFAAQPNRAADFFACPPPGRAARYTPDRRQE